MEDHRSQSTDEQPMEVDQDTASVTDGVRGRPKRKAQTEKAGLRTRSTESRQLRSSSKVSTTTRRAASVSAKPKPRTGRRSTLKNEEDSTVAAEEAVPKKRRKVA